MDAHLSPISNKDNGNVEEIINLIPYTHNANLSKYHLNEILQINIIFNFCPA